MDKLIRSVGLRLWELKRPCKNVRISISWHGIPPTQTQQKPAGLTDQMEQYHKITINHNKFCSKSIVYERVDEDESIGDIVNAAEAIDEYMATSAMR